MKTRACNKNHTPVIIMIAGGSCSGKSFIAREIKKKYPCLNIISQDWYYKNKKWTSSSELEKLEALDLKLMKANLKQLIETGECQAPVYDFVTSSRSKKIKELKLNPIIIIEGLYAFAIEKTCQKLSQKIIKIYIQANENTMMDRRIKRDQKRKCKNPEEIRSNFRNIVLPAFRKYIKAYEKQAHISIKNNTHTLPDLNELWKLMEKYK